MKNSLQIPLVIGGIPLIAYPFVLLSNVMSLAGHPSAQPAPADLHSAAQSFLWASTFYPVVYCGCAFMAYQESRKYTQNSAVLVSLLPLFYLGLIGYFLANWIRLSP